MAEPRIHPRENFREEGGAARRSAVSLTLMAFFCLNLLVCRSWLRFIVRAVEICFIAHKEVLLSIGSGREKQGRWE